MKHTWSVGEVVEVAGDPDEGFPASWSTGSVKEFVDGSSLMRVQYHEVWHSKRLQSLRFSVFRLNLT